MIIIKNDTNQLISDHAKSTLTLAFFILGILVALTSFPLSYIADKAKTAEINCKILRIKKEMPSVISAQAAKYPYCVKIKSAGSDKTIVFLPTKNDAINYVKANSNTSRIFAANYVTLSGDSDQLKEGSNTLLSMKVDQMQVKSTTPALHKLFNEAVENN